MKLRLRADTLRLRLTRGEVDALGRGESVSETTPFPDGTSLRYELATAQQYSAQQLINEQGVCLRIEVPGGDASRWAQSEQVGFVDNEPLQLGPLQILIEKDFTCITPRDGEEELDTFPNPNALAGHGSVA